FRATLFMAAGAIKMDRILDDLAGTKGSKRLIPKATRNSVRESAKCSQKYIGAGWTKRIRDTRSFAGLNVKDLAAVCGYAREYLVLYGPQCHVAHGGDAPQHLFLHDQGATLKIASDPKTVAERIEVAACYFATVLNDLSGAFQLNVGPGIESAYRRL